MRSDLKIQINDSRNNKGIISAIHIPNVKRNEIKQMIGEENV